MRVLFSSTFGHGHVFPMVPLARAFRDAGHEVLWATNGFGVTLVADAGIAVREVGLTGPALQAVHQDLLQQAALRAPAERAAFMFPIMFGAALTPPMAVDLLSLAKEWRPDLMVHEQGELGSPLVGAVLGVPSLTHSFGGGVPAAFLAAAAEQLAPLWDEYGVEQPPFAGCFTAPYLDICPPSVQIVPLDHVPTIQPLRPVPYAGEDIGALADVPASTSRPLVYLTLGTVSSSGPLLANAIAGLAALDVQVLVTLGPKVDPASLGPLPSGVSVERFVPQTAVVPRTAVVVSHAGSGTFLCALGHGVPQLCLPQGADQFRNAEGGVRAGAALALAPDEASPDAIADAVKRLLVEETFRDRARVVADGIRTMPSPADVVTTLTSRM
jgi:UDP:flavonoid glycosyltransferase YjiC (YdhE family)